MDTKLNSCRVRGLKRSRDDYQPKAEIRHLVNVDKIHTPVALPISLVLCSKKCVVQERPRRTTFPERRASSVQAHRLNGLSLNVDIGSDTVPRSVPVSPEARSPMFG